MEPERTKPAVPNFSKAEVTSLRTSAERSIIEGVDFDSSLGSIVYRLNEVEKKSVAVADEPLTIVEISRYSEPFGPRMEHRASGGVS